MHKGSRHFQIRYMGLPSLACTDCFWFKLTHNSFSLLLLEPDTSSAITEDTSGSSSAHCTADCIQCSGTAAATVLVAGTDISSFNYTFASDTTSAITAAATAKRCSFSTQSLLWSFWCLVCDDYIFVCQKTEVIVEIIWQGPYRIFSLNIRLPAAICKAHCLQ